MDTEAHLILTLVVGGVWTPEFVFTLLPVALDKLDVLDAKLRDALDEIDRLKAAQKARETVFMSVSSQVACTNQQYVVWNGATPNEMSKDYFSMSADLTTATIRKDGVYQVYVRLGGTNNGNTQFLCLQLNGADKAKCIQSDGSNHQNTAQLTEILRLKAGDTMRVRCGCNGNSLADTAANRFNILLIGY